MNVIESVVMGLLLGLNTAGAVDLYDEDIAEEVMCVDGVTYMGYGYEMSPLVAYLDEVGTYVPTCTVTEEGSIIVEYLSEQ